MYTVLVVGRETHAQTTCVSSSGYAPGRSVSDDACLQLTRNARVLLQLIPVRVLPMQANAFTPEPRLESDS